MNLRLVILICCLLVPWGARADVWTVTPDALVAIDAATGAVTRTIALDEPPVGNVGLAVDGETAYLVSNLIRRIRLADGTELAPFHPPCCLLGVILVDESRLYVVGEEFGVFLATLDKATGRLQSVIELPEGTLAAALAPVPAAATPTATSIPTPTATQAMAVATPTRTVAVMVPTPTETTIAAGNGGGCQVQRGTHPGSMLLLLFPLLLCAYRCHLSRLSRVDQVREDGHRNHLLHSVRAFLPLLLVLALPAHATTWSVDNGPSQFLAWPPGAHGPPAVEYRANGGGTQGWPGGDCGDEGGGAGTCIPTVVEDIPPWREGHTYFLGVEVTNLWRNYIVEPPGGGMRFMTKNEALLHVRDWIDTVSAVFKRDVGVRVYLRHIRILENVTYAHHSDAWSFWAANLPTVNAVLTIHPNDAYGGSFDLASICGGGGGYAAVSLRSDARTHNDWWRSNVNIIGHELSHGLGARHSGHYVDANGERAEYCPDDCYTGPTICPTYADQSWVGKCRFSCNNVGTLRVHSPGGPLIDAMRAVIEERAACLRPAAIRAPGPHGDADGDEYPDDLDNCPNVANEGQEDADGDGFGNPCDGCAVCSAKGRPASAWSLLALLPVLGVVAAKRAKEGTDG